MNTSSEHDALRKKLEHCEAHNTAKSEFLSMVVHQLRTPLSGNKWIFKMLLDGDLGAFSEEQRSVIQKGYESNEQMIQLLNEIIVANQHDEWDFTYTFCKGDLEKIIESVITEYSQEASAKQIDLIFERPYRSLPLVEMDPEKIRLVLLNLFENALKYSKTQGRIIVTLVPKEDTVTISIEDNGIGISAHQQKDIFKKFFRADNAKIAKKHGTGLGLFTAQHIARHHKGELSFTSTEGKGSTFYLSLPIHQN